MFDKGARPVCILASMDGPVITDRDAANMRA